MQKASENTFTISQASKESTHPHHTISSPCVNKVILSKRPVQLSAAAWKSYKSHLCVLKASNQCSVWSERGRGSTWRPNTKPGPTLNTSERQRCKMRQGFLLHWLWPSPPWADYRAKQLNHQGENVIRHCRRRRQHKKEKVKLLGLTKADD